MQHPQHPVLPSQIPGENAKSISSHSESNKQVQVSHHSDVTQPDMAAKKNSHVKTPKSELWSNCSVPFDPWNLTGNGSKWSAQPAQLIHERKRTPKISLHKRFKGGLPIAQTYFDQNFKLRNLCYGEGENWWTWGRVFEAKNIRSQITGDDTCLWYM